jgi:hypothetical protein
MSGIELQMLGVTSCLVTTHTELPLFLKETGILEKRALLLALNVEGRTVCQLGGEKKCVEIVK